MGIYAEYLNRMFDINGLNNERKIQLDRISKLRKRSILTFASALSKGNAPIGIDYDDIVPIMDQLSNIQGEEIDIILETPGGYAEYAEQIVESIRTKFKDVAFIIPGAAMSAGTIMAMAGDDILMSPYSALGPIDAQIMQQGKRFSAHAFIEGLNKIKDEVADTGVLNKAYIPILQNVSPGEIQSAQNAYDFALDLVGKWLAKYKFKNWDKHKTNPSLIGKPVTKEEKKQRALEIADKLRDHSIWKTHGRQIKINSLREMKLIIKDYSENAELYDAIQRYFILLKMTFDATDMFKMYETPTSQIYRHTHPRVQKHMKENNVKFNLQCNKCGNVIKIQANLEKGIKLESGYIKMPKEDTIKCNTCNIEHNLLDLKKQIEQMAGRPIIYD
ncbi:MAG: ATP-dependent Clp protease proteolytic subunit [Endomicrobiales bacterium]|nr:ATP-dependent Clp protease proteolytic subunit [Endomicrobiales bacterium]